MPTVDQIRIINELCDSHKAHLLNLVAHVPADWDGIELRQWFADTAQQQYAHPMPTARRKAYKSAYACMP